MKQIKLKVNHLEPEKRYLQNYITQYLGTLGIAPQDISAFIGKPRPSDEEDPLNLDSMQVAVDTAYGQLKAGVQVFVQVDSDTDGYTSSAILINYLMRRFNASVDWRLHSGKEHGIIVETVPTKDTLVFIPDAGSNQFKEQRELVEQGKTVIVLDHHEVDNFEETGAIIVNNQISANCKNKSLSGAGVVFKFIQQMDKTYFKDSPIYEDYRDLAAIGIIADAMNMTTLDNNYFAYYGLNNIKSKFIHELALKQARGIKDPEHLTKTDVAFYIAPVINGVIRSGSTEDKETVFKALTYEDNNIYPHTWRGNTTNETLYQLAARLAANAKSRQDSSKKKAFEWLCDYIRENHLDQDNIIIVALDDKDAAKINANLTGLIAMELVKEFNRPVLVLRKTEYEGVTVYGGSGRNGNFFGLPSLKDALEAAGGYYQAGHANACGSFLLPEQLDQVTKFFNTNYNASAFNSLYEVDYWFHLNETIDIDMLMELAEYDSLWGNSIPQPKFAMDMLIDSNDVFLMGANKTSIKIKKDGVDFVIFSNPELADQLSHISNNTHVQIVGRAQINEWMDRKSVQIMVDDIAIVPQKVVTNIIDLI